MKQSANQPKASSVSMFQRWRKFTKSGEKNSEQSNPYVPFPLPVTTRKLLFITAMYAVNFWLMTDLYWKYWFMFLMVGGSVVLAVALTTLSLIPAKKWFLPAWSPNETLYGYFYWLSFTGLFWHPILTPVVWYAFWAERYMTGVMK